MKFLSTSNDDLRFWWHSGFVFDKVCNVDFFDKVNDENAFLDYYPKVRKMFKKTIGGKRLNLKTAAMRRDRDLSSMSMFVNLAVRGGNKETFIKYWNQAIDEFMIHFYEKDDFFYSFPRYYYYYYLVKEEKTYFVFNNILDECLENLQVIFNMKYRKLNKQQRLKLKVKHKLVITLIHPRKRYKHTLNLLNHATSNMNFHNLNDRLLKVFAYACFNPEKSYIWNRKTYIYSLVLEEYNKKHD